MKLRPFIRICRKTFIKTFILVRDRIYKFFSYTGSVLILFAQTVFWMFAPRLRKWQVLEQMNKVKGQGPAVDQRILRA